MGKVSVLAPLHIFCMLPQRFTGLEATSCGLVIGSFVVEEECAM